MNQLSPQVAEQAIRSCVTYPLADSLRDLPHVTLEFKDWVQLEQEVSSNLGVRVVDTKGVVKELLPFLSEGSFLAKETKWMDIVIEHRTIRVLMNGPSQRVLYVNVESLYRAIDAIQGIVDREKTEWKNTVLITLMGFVTGMTLSALIRH